MENEIRELYNNQFYVSDFEFPLTKDEMLLECLEFALTLESFFGILIEDEEIKIAPVEYWIDLVKRKIDGE